MEKTRETHHHHAVDATLCAVSPFVNIAPYEYKFDEVENKAYMVDTETGEMIDYPTYKKMKTDDRKSYIVQFDNFLENLYPNKLHQKIKFSHQVNRKNNRKISDATLYSTREKKETKISRGKEVEISHQMIIGKIKDIYTVDGYKMYMKRKDDLLIKDIDPKSFEILENILLQYPDYREVQSSDGKVKRVPESPFKLYIEDNDIPGIQKYSKKGNGPIIRSLKYYDKKLGNHINVTKDEQGKEVEKTRNNRSVVLLSLNPWRTDVYYSKSEDKFKLLGIKYNHLKFIEGEYGVPNEVYNELKKKEGITSDDEFRFSLYKKDMVEFRREDEVLVGLYHSRTNESHKNYFEIKPIDKNKWEGNKNIAVFGKITKSGQFVKGLANNITIRKLYVDILGKRYYVDKEELKDII